MNIKQKVVDLIRYRTTSLPTLPVVVNNIVEVVRSETTSAKDLAKFIANDQAISARVLRVANSVYYGMSQKIDSISRAIVVIGFREILSLALGTGIISALSKKGNEVTIDMAELWKHSIGVGFAAMNIAKKTRNAVEESAVLIGLLHDIGKIIFALYFPKEYAEVLKKTADEKTPLHVIEKSILGLDHAEMAALLMKQWNFPPNIIQPVRYHHYPCECAGEQGYVAMVLNVANVVCHQSGIGQSGNMAIEKDTEVLGKLELSDQKIVSLAEELESERPRIDEFLVALS